MAQYYQIVSSMTDIKQICENLNLENLQIVQMPSDDLQQFGQQQIILSPDQQVIIHENQLPQLVYHQQNQMPNQTTQYIIQEDSISGAENFSGQQQQLFYAQEVSSDNSQLIQQSQIQQQNDQGQQHTTIHHIQSSSTNQRQVIQQIQQQQQQTSPSQQVIMQPQQHLVVHSQNPQQTVVLQQMNRSVQQTNQRQVLYNPSTNVIYGESTSQQILAQQQIQQQLQNRAVQSRPVLQQRGVIRQPRASSHPRLQTPTTQVVQIQHPTPQLQQQQVTQQRVIITPFNQATQQSQSVAQQPQLATPILQPRLVQPTRRQYTPRAGSTVRTPRAPRHRNPAPVQQIQQQQIIAKYLPPKMNTPRVTLTPQIPNATQGISRPRGPRFSNTVQHRFVTPPQNVTVAGLTERKPVSKFPTPSQNTTMTQPCTTVNIARTQQKNNLTHKAQVTSSQATPSTSSQSSQSSSDFDADDLENSITAAVVSKNPTTPANEPFNTSQSSISSQESPISQQINEESKKNTTVTSPARKITADEYRRINQQPPALKYTNNRSVVNSINRQKQIQQQHQIHASRLRTDMGQNSQIDETRNSAKMLVILENGEQRLITFTLPKESCTVQELLEQVGVQFSHETNIQCVSNPGANIDYVVTVGVNQDSNSTEIVAVDNSIQNTQLQQQSQQQPPQSMQQCFAQQQQQPQLQQQSQPPPLAHTTTQQTVVVEQPPKPKSPEPPKEPPSKFIEGYYAVCSACGYSGFDHAKCQRCRRIFTEEPKRQPAKPQQSGNPQQSSSNTTTSPINVPLKSTVTTITTTTTVPIEKDKKEITKKINEIVTKTMRGRGGAGRGRGRGRGRHVEAEPVILTLSSDDEGESQTSPAQRVPAIPSPTNCQPMPFEPVISESTEMPIDFVRESIADVKNSDDKQIYTLVQCRSIRIGSYRFEPTEKLLFASKGIRIIAPNCKDKNDNVILDIGAHEIVKICVHFAKSLSIVFLYVIPSCGAYIRESLDMATSKNDSAPYFNPAETTDIYKKIILQIENISEDSKSVIRSIYLSTILEEISKRDATELYNRSNNADTCNNTCSDNIRQILIYPQGKGGISINTEDYMCLGSDQYLNDIIIDFYLNYLQLAVLTEEQKAKTHVFSSFFYKRLTTTSTRQRANEKDVKLTASQKRHARVKSWTKNVNIFEKDFIIIPINEQSHWFLAIICFPGLKGSYTMDTNMPIKNTPAPKKKGEKKISLQIGSTTITPVTKKEVDSIYLGEDSLSERDEAEGDDSDMASDESDDEYDGKLQPIKQPCILIFDSLAGTSRSRVVATLRDYLTCEYKVKVFENSTHVFNKLNIPGNSVKVPQQTNFTDCGLYLLQYVEYFFKYPIKDYRLPIKQLVEWFESIVVTRKREEISELLKSLIAKYNPDALPLPEVGFPTLNGKLVEQEESLHDETGEFEEEDELDNMFEEDEEFLDFSPEKKSTSSQQNGDRKRNLTASSPLNTTESEPKIKKKILE